MYSTCSILRKPTSMHAFSPIVLDPPTLLRDVKCFKLPKEETLRQGAPSVQKSIRSKSWQLLSSRAERP